MKYQTNEKKIYHMKDKSKITFPRVLSFNFRTMSKEESITWVNANICVGLEIQRKLLVAEKYLRCHRKIFIFILCVQIKFPDEMT